MNTETPIILCKSNDCKYNFEQRYCKLFHVELDNNLTCITHVKIGDVK